MKYLDSKKLMFKKEENKLLSLEYDGKSYERVSLQRCFPINSENEYISVRYGEDNTELGIIKDVNQFEDAEKQKILDELNLRYFIPTILKVNKFKDKKNFITLDVTTDAGDKQIIIRDITWNIIDNKERGLILKDVDENYYKITNEYINSKDKKIRFIKNYL